MFPGRLESGELQISRIRRKHCLLSMRSGNHVISMLARWLRSVTFCNVTGKSPFRIFIEKVTKWLITSRVLGMDCHREII
ncbi:hypothetical protein LINPERHAP1_LOCUS3705 [Linum perenne]